MPGEQTDQQTPIAPGADKDGATKLIFGKYKTIEEAEKAHKELERNFHEGRQEYSRLNDRLEVIENSRNQDEGYGRGQRFTPQADDQPDKTRVLTEFYQDPIKVLNEVETRATQRAKAELVREQQQNNDHASRVQAWTQQNQDVVAYPELLTYWVGQTDGRLSIETRLTKAAEKVRQRVIELKGKPTEAEPEPDEIVEGVDASGALARKPVKQVAAQSDPESQLASYASQRNSKVRRPLNVPRAKA